ncbi:hypothetical protein ACSHWB_38745 [Lentzea sp. HUAS TT2]|uniref:hypothetical protein n=1 Tax=Lentzea sp. HUAS TT2 TaxID=3447454 RepID=UPI003F6ED45D
MIGNPSPRSLMIRSIVSAFSMFAAIPAFGSVMRDCPEFLARFSLDPALDRKWSLCPMAASSCRPTSPVQQSPDLVSQAFGGLWAAGLVISGLSTNLGRGTRTLAPNSPWWGELLPAGLTSEVEDNRCPEV